MTLKSFNLFDGETEVVPPGAPGAQGQAARVGSILGMEKLGMSVYDLPAGEAIGPFHVEWTHEELLIAVAGQVHIRGTQGEQTLNAGDVISFPTGFAGAHQVRNMSDAPARVAIVSAQNEVCIVEYPDEKKLAIWAGAVYYTLDHQTG